MSAAILEQRVASFALMSRVLQSALHSPNFWLARLGGELMPVTVSWTDERLTLSAIIDITLSSGDYIVEFLCHGEPLIAIPVAISDAVRCPTIDWSIDFSVLPTHA